MREQDDPSGWAVGPAAPQMSTQPRGRADAGLAWLSGLVAFGLAAMMLAISYKILRDYAEAHEYSGWVSWVWPTGLDGLMVVASLAVLDAARRGRRDWYALALVGVGIGASLAFNIAHARTTPGRFAAVVPPTTAALALELFLRRFAQNRARAVAEAAAVAVAAVRPGAEAREVFIPAARQETARDEAAGAQDRPAEAAAAAAPAEARSGSQIPAADRVAVRREDRTARQPVEAPPADVSRGKGAAATRQPAEALPTNRSAAARQPADAPPATRAPVARQPAEAPPANTAPAARQPTDTPRVNGVPVAPPVPTGMGAGPGRRRQLSAREHGSAAADRSAAERDSGRQSGQAPAGAAASAARATNGGQETAKMRVVRILEDAARDNPDHGLTASEIADQVGCSVRYATRVAEEWNRTREQDIARLTEQIHAARAARNELAEHRASHELATRHGPSVLAAVESALTDDARASSP